MGLFVLLFKFTLISCGGLRTFVGMNPIFWNSPICRFGQKHPSFPSSAIPAGTPYQRGDDLPKATYLPRALQALFFPACKFLRAVFRVCG